MRRLLPLLLASALLLPIVPVGGAAPTPPRWSATVGSDGYDHLGSVAVDAGGNTYAAWTAHWAFNDNDVWTYQQSLFVEKRSPMGEVLWRQNFSSTEDVFLAGIAVVNGEVILGGSFNSHLMTVYAYGGDHDVFIAKLDASTGAFKWAFAFGGSADDRATDVDTDASGNVYVAGGTSSCDYPWTSNAYQRTSRSCASGFGEDGFLTKFASEGGRYIYSTYLGGSGMDIPHALVVSRSSGSAYLAGFTTSTDFPLTSGAFDKTIEGEADMFVAKLASNGSLAWSTLLGGHGFDLALDLARDANGNVYVAGFTDDAGMPTTPGAHQTDFSGADCSYDSGPGGFIVQNCDDGYVAKLSSEGRLVYGTYLGGVGEDEVTSIAVDSSGGAYVMGITNSTDFPWMGGWTANTSDEEWPVFSAALTPSGNALMYAVSPVEVPGEFDWPGEVATSSDGASSYLFDQGDDLAAVRAGPPESSLLFAPRAIQEWWVEVALGGREANLVTKVEARDDDSDWTTLSKEPWGKWGGSLHVEPGHNVTFRVTLSTGAVRQSCAYDAAFNCVAVVAPPFDATFSSVKGNEWWIQASVGATGGTLAKVEVSLNGGAWKPLANKGWGWAASYHAPAGTIVQLRATSTTGATDLSGCYRWTEAAPTACLHGDPPPPPPPNGTFSATWKNVRGNEWWVETDVSVSGGTLAGVDARVNGGAWVALTKQSWGSWAKSIHVAPGSTVEFRARAADGQTAVSGAYAWPPG